MNFDEFFGSGETRKKISTTADPKLYDETMKLLEKHGKKFSEFVDYAMNELLKEQSKKKKGK